MPDYELGTQIILTTRILILNSEFGIIQLFLMLTILLMYNSSTFARAQGVLRKNVRLDLMLGLLIKQLMGINFPKRSKPNSSTSSVTIFSSVTP